MSTPRAHEPTKRPTRGVRPKKKQRTAQPVHAGPFSYLVDLRCQPGVSRGVDIDRLTEHLWLMGHQVQVVDQWVDPELLQVIGDVTTSTHLLGRLGELVHHPGWLPGVQAQVTLVASQDATPKAVHDETLSEPNGLREVVVTSTHLISTNRPGHRRAPGFWPTLLPWEQRSLVTTHPQTGTQRLVLPTT